MYEVVHMQNCPLKKNAQIKTNLLGKKPMLVNFLQTQIREIAVLYKFYFFKFFFNYF